MFYKGNIFSIILVISGLSLNAQDYSIQSEIIEVDADLDQIIYKKNVLFISDNVTFNADELVVIESTEKFTATGEPVKIRFFDGYEFIEGEAKKVEIIDDNLMLSDSVSFVRSGNTIRSESLIIKLKKND
tara:strand:- start:488 stop:877 length:390 start_codon:yes stop_codon:yes gene_type:complete